MQLSLNAVRDLSLAALVLCAAGAVPAFAKTFVYVSNAQDGNIDGYTLDKRSGTLTSVGKAEAGKLVMPMAVSPNQKLLYAAIRSDPFRVITYAIDPTTGALTQKATAPLPDSMPYVSVDRTGRFLFTASYGGDKIAVSPISKNGLVEAAAIQVIATGRNAHAILADRTNKFVYVPNLGANQVLQFLFDAKTGKLTANDPAAVMARPGNGPRHLVFARDNRHVYVLNELTGNIAQFAIDQKKGTLREVDSVGSVPKESGLVPGVAQAPVGAAPPPGAAAKVDERAEDLGRRYSAHAQRQVPVFHGAHTEQDRAVLRRTGDGKADVRDQFFHREAAARHQDRSERNLPCRLWREVRSPGGLQDRPKQRAALRDRPLSGRQRRQLGRNRRHTVARYAGRSDLPAAWPLSRGQAEPASAHLRLEHAARQILAAGRCQMQRHHGDVGLAR